MQKPSANAGMGFSLGGGAAEFAFGSDTAKVLTKWTVSGIATFFIVAFVLSMLHIRANAHRQSYAEGINLENIVPDAKAPDK
jgi:protein translocase SecG subunit